MNYIRLFEEFVRKTSFTPEEVKIFIDYFNPILAEGRKILDPKIESFFDSDSYFDLDNRTSRPLWVNYEIKWLNGIQSFSDDYSRYVMSNYSEESYNKILGWAHLFYSLYDTLKRGDERYLKDGTKKAKVLYQYKLNCFIPSDIMINIGLRNFDYNISSYTRKRLKRILGDDYSVYVQVYDERNFNQDRKDDKYIKMIITITDEKFEFNDPFK